MYHDHVQSIFTALKSNYHDSYVPISSNAVIRTLKLEPHALRGREGTPLVMVHGFGAGLLQFYKNLDYIHSERCVYALDLPGFGRSTRKPFPLNPVHAEREYVENLEVWRKTVGVEKFVLLGHSFGAYLACAYTLRHPSRVRHLILVDPWGFAHPPDEQELKEKFKQSSWFWRAAAKLKPFTLVRAAGPWGPDIIKRFRKDLSRTFGDDFLNYIYHCNAQKPTGELAYYSMQHYFAWAKHPMLNRLSSELSPTVPITVVSGSRSWLHMGQTEGIRTPDRIAESRQGSYVDVKYVEGAGHHVHADCPVEFNQIVNAVLLSVDSEQDSHVVQ